MGWLKHECWGAKDDQKRVVNLFPLTIDALHFTPSTIIVIVQVIKSWNGRSMAQ
ncbi:MAG: hypothetical protein MZU84_06680 [Sphingobacterium sp.]|nr:hypothetical protein [Sphingobacterium sp.]